MQGWQRRHLWEPGAAPVLLSVAQEGRRRPLEPGLECRVPPGQRGWQQLHWPERDASFAWLVVPASVWGFADGQEQRWGTAAERSWAAARGQRDAAAAAAPAGGRFLPGLHMGTPSVRCGGPCLAHRGSVD